MFFVWLFIVGVGLLFIKVGKLGYKEDKGSQLILLFGWVLMIFAVFYAFTYMSI
ncbi:hypothetical protein C7M29_03054 [Bacillus subtilis]|nr:hypothetical protein C7M29_03054 [Bacillus subtilis]